MRWMLGAALAVLLGVSGVAQAQAQAQLGGASKDGAPAPGKPAEAAAPAATQQCPDNASAYANSSESFACLCPSEAMGTGSVWGSDIYTADSGICRAAQHAGLITRRGGAVTVQMLPGQPRYIGLTRNGVQSQNYGAYDSSFRFEGTGGRPAAAPAPGGPTRLAQCPDSMSAFENSDETVICGCSALAVAQSATVWGSDTYTADSAPCRAALHAGAVGRQGGEATIRMGPGEARYLGVTRNGVQAQSYGAYRSSFRFAGVAAATGPGLCPDTLMALRGSDEALTCLCPGEATARGSVWGSDVYTADSGTCRAAVHAGVIGLGGGTVSLRMLPGQPRYVGLNRNGVPSQSYGAYDTSFRFEGGQRAQGNVPLQAPVAESLKRSGQVQLYVTFRTGSADLDITAAPVLSQVRDAMVADPTLRLRLIGHTDSQGSAQTNIPLSIRRAESVRMWLAQNGVTPDRLLAEGRGQAEPIADNGSEAGRALNRRVQAVRLQ